MVVRFQLDANLACLISYKEPYDFYLKQLQYQSAPCIID